MKMLDITLKDMLRFSRSLFAVGMAVVAPLLVAGLIYFAFGGISRGRADLPVFEIGVVNYDAPPANGPALGDLLVSMLSDESVASWLQVTQMPDEAAARAAVDRQEIGGAIIIPSNFSASALGGAERANLILVHDPTLSIGPAVVQDMIGSFLDGIHGAQVALTVIAERQSTPGTFDAAQQQAVAARFQTWFTDFQRTMYHSPEAALIVQAPEADPSQGQEQAGSMQQIMGLVMSGQMIFFAFYTGAYAMTSILREEEEGTLARLFTAPIDRTVVLAGKFLAVVLIVMVQSIVMVALGKLVFGIRWGQPASVGIALVGQVLAASGLGVLLISLVKNMRQAGPVLGSGLTAAGMLGGLFTVAVPNVPAMFNTVSLFTPQGWVMRAWKVTMSGGAVTDLVLPGLILLAMGAVMFGLGATFFRRRFV